MSALANPQFWIGVGVLAGIYGIFSLGLQLNLGLTGVYNFGQVGVHGHRCLHDGDPRSPRASVAVGSDSRSNCGLVGMLAGVFVGLATLRLRADYFAITTLAFAMIVKLVALNGRQA